MKIKAILTGATGMIGKSLLLEAISDPSVENVLTVTRTPIDIQHPKVKSVILQDFFKPESIASELVGFNTCFFCLGQTVSGMTEEKYHNITYNLTIGFAKLVAEKNPDLSFFYISGAGCNSKSKIMWARVKGMTEDKLLTMPFKNAYMFRPGYIQPMKGVRSRTPLYNGFYFIFKPFYFILKHFPKYVTSSEQLAKAMIKTATEGYDKKVLESIDINSIK